LLHIIAMAGVARPALLVLQGCKMLNRTALL
jgi:hypothetical protein